MSRYLKGVITGFDENQVPYKVISPVGAGLTAKYLKYVWLAFWNGKKKGRHIIISERYAYLTWFIREKKQVICHDLHTLHAEAKTPKIHLLVYRFFLKSMYRAEEVICVSEYTKTDLLKHCPKFISHPGVKAIHNGLESFWFESGVQLEAAQEWTDLFRKTKVLLSVGTDAWYKNNSWSLELLAKLGDEYHLLRVGAFSEKNRRLITSLGLQAKVSEVSGLSDKELKYAYENATALLFPSVSEGFGWPAIEASVCGCPVIANYQEPMNEVFRDPSEIITLDIAIDKIRSGKLPVATPVILKWRDQVLRIIG